MTIIDLQTKRQERARDAAHKLRRSNAVGQMHEMPSAAYVKALEEELLAERALGQVSADLLQECESVLRQCRGLP
jgi:methylthioribose-1-phosphate isomerase